MWTCRVHNSRRFIRKGRALRLVLKDARNLALVFVSVLLSISVSFPFQSAAAHVGTASGSQFYLSTTGLACTLGGVCPPSAMPTPCLNPPNYWYGSGNMSHSVPGKISSGISLQYQFGTWETDFCTSASYSYPSLTTISSVTVALRIAQATKSWAVVANLYDFGTVSNPNTTPVLLATTGGNVNFGFYTPRLHSCSTSKLFTVHLTPTTGAQLVSGDILGLQLLIGGYSGGHATACFGSWNTSWTSISSLSVK